MWCVNYSLALPDIYASSLEHRAGEPQFDDNRFDPWSFLYRTRFPLQLKKTYRVAAVLLDGSSGALGHVRTGPGAVRR
jgi:hypothetical protein